MDPAMKKLIIERCKELVAFLSGSPPQPALPGWVRRNGMRVAGAVFSPEIRRSFESEGGSFLQGIISGIASVGTSEELKGAATEVFGGKIAYIHESPSVDLRQSWQKEIAASIAAHVTDEPAARLAFFRGYVFGLDMPFQLKQIERKIDEAWRMRRRLSLYLLLWVRWPEFEAMRKIDAVYETCRREFARSDIWGEENMVRDVLPAKNTFRRMMERDGYTELRA